MGLYSANTIKLETNIENKHSVEKSKMAGGRPVCRIQSAAKELNSWQQEQIQRITSPAL